MTSLFAGLAHALGDRLAAWRNRALASAAFRRRAAAFALTRPFARAHAAEVFDLCAGFVYSQILYACVRLGLFEQLEGGARAPAELAAVWQMSPAAALRLLDAAAALELVRWCADGRCMLGRHGAVIAAEPGILAMVAHHAVLYADLADPLALLRDEDAPTALSRYWAYSRTADGDALGAADVAAYSALMSTSQTLVASEILDAYPLDRHRCLLDVAGGEGGFLMAAAARAPGLQLKLFELPGVAARARARLDQAGLAARSEVVAGDFQHTPLPDGADLVSLVRVIHDHDDAKAQALLAAAHRALPAGGTLLLAEPMAAAPAAARVGHAYFGFYLLAMRSGRPRSADELGAMLRTAGFQSSRVVPTRMPLQTGLIVAQA